MSNTTCPFCYEPAHPDGVCPLASGPGKLAFHNTGNPAPAFVFHLDSSDVRLPDTPDGVNTGWICPLCSRSVSPYIGYCNCRSAVPQSAPYPPNFPPVTEPWRAANDLSKNIS